MSATNLKKVYSPPGRVTEPFEDRNATAAVCRSVPNGVSNVANQTDECTTSTELNRNTNFATTTFKLQKDIETLRGMVGDSLAMGDTMFGQFGYSDVTKQVKARNNELAVKKDTLVQAISKKEAIIERSDRDFSDVRDTLPEVQPKRVLHFIEDYTLAILSISYLFMIITMIYIYTATSEFKLIGFGKSLVSSIILTMFLFMVLIYST